MEGLSYVLKKIATLAKVGIYYTEGEGLQSFAQNTEGNPIWGSVRLRELLQKGADQQEEPYVYQDEYTVYFACLKKGKDYFFVGPMSLKLLSRLELHQFYQHYGIKGNEEKRLGYFTVSKVIDIVELLATQIMNCPRSYPCLRP